MSNNTCGEGLAHHAALPARLADLLSAVAENLEAHLTALDPNDPQSKPEHQAYVSLSGEHRAIESRLRALAGRMAASATLPMANHDEAALASPRLREAFARLVAEERATVDLLQEWIAQHQAMLQ
jgi:hypothetical protein